MKSDPLRPSGLWENEKELSFEWDGSFFAGKT